MIPLRVCCGGIRFRLDELLACLRLIPITLRYWARMRALMLIVGLFVCGMSSFFPLYVLSVCVCVCVYVYRLVSFSSLFCVLGEVRFPFSKSCQCLSWIDCFSMRSKRFIRTVLWFFCSVLGPVYSFGKHLRSALYKTVGTCLMSSLACSLFL